MKEGNNRQTIGKRLMLAGLLCVTLLGASCGGGKETSGKQEEGPVFFTYETEGNINCVTVDDDGTVYVCSTEESGEMWKNRVILYDNQGNEVHRWTDEEERMSSSIEVIAVYQDKAYFTALDNEIRKCIYELDLSNGDCTVFCEIPDLVKISRMCLSKDKLFLLGNSIATPASSRGSMQNGGNKSLYVIDMHTKERREQFLNEAIALSDMPDGNIMLYAYDEEEGYVLISIDAESMKILDITPTQIEGICSFAYDGRGLLFYSPNAVRISDLNTLSYSVLKEGTVADVMPNMAVPDGAGIFFRNGFTYVWNGMDGKIERLKNSVYIKDTREIRIVGSGVYGAFVFFAGYTTTFEEKSDEELSLAVLSNDRDFDVFYMGSHQSMAKNLKENGVYYPLNDVPYVREYMESCFPYIEEAATDKDGNIWMIPVNVSIPILIYNEEKCKALGVDFASADTPEKLLAGVSKCAESREYEFLFNPSSFIQSNMEVYLRTHTAFDTADFRSLAANMKEASQIPWGNGNPSLSYLTGAGSVSFSSEESEALAYEELMHSDEEKACSLSTFDGASSSARCTYICVNPASDNLDTVLACISALCEYMLSVDNYGLFGDKSRYPDSQFAASVYEIYKDGVIDFSAPGEIYMLDLERYFASELSLEDMIKEADRRMSVYLNE
ncbi:MAG: hypothetical protein NC081_05200 [Roseburia sp.]|nr:hypothetical protein [Roseburia sp.]